MFDLGQGRDPSRENLDPFPSSSSEQHHQPFSEDWSSRPADNPYDITPSYTTKRFGPRLKFGASQRLEETTNPWAGEMTRNPFFRGGRESKSNPLRVLKIRTLWPCVRSSFTMALPTEPVAPVMVKMDMTIISIVKLTIRSDFC